MKILYVASEVTPYAASGGLGDVMGALPRTVKRQLGKGAEVSVILPLYSGISESYRSAMKKVTEGICPLAWRRAYYGVYRLSSAGVNYYFIDNEQYFKRGRMYGEFDDGERFAFFCRAVISFMLDTGWYPDVLHANDWQSAMTVIYLKTRFAHHPELSRIRTVYTIHNIEYQGKYDMAILGDVFDIPGEYASSVECDGCLNLMKGAIQLSDRVNTVSPHYAEELRDPYFSFGLDPMIRRVFDKFSGILNGLDTVFFDPSNGDEIAYPYKLSTLAAGKAENKKFLQEELGLPVSPDIPLIAMITRLTPAKGIDLVIRILDELLFENLQFVLLGTGDREYEYILREIAGRHPDSARVLCTFDRTLSKRIYAAADLFLMPSRSEPCGLAQMTACAYGTVPVVRGVGGLYDTIIPYGRENSNGFVFYNYNAHDLLFRVKDALALYRAGDGEWDKLRRRAMRSDFGWKNSAKAYIELYNSL